MRFRERLPQVTGDDLFLTDSGMETQFIFLDGVELPEFASFDLFKRKGGEAMLRRYYQTYVALAEAFRTGLVLESPTWRASADWGARLGYGATDLAGANRRAIGLLEGLRDEFRGEGNVVISGCLGPGATGTFRRI